MIAWLFWIYVAMGVAGLAILLVMMFLGGMDLGFDGVDVDVGDLDGGPGVGMPIVLSFISAFGGLSAILTYMGVHVALTPVISVVCSIGISTVLFLLTRYFLKHFSSDSTVRYRGLIGKSGSVSVSIRPGEEGQIVVFTDQRGRTLIPAVSDRRIATNAEVVITGMVGSAVKVVGRREWELGKEKKGKKRGSGST